jgi:hypothetical protein
VLSFCRRIIPVVDFGVQAVLLGFDGIGFNVSLALGKCRGEAKLSWDAIGTMRGVKVLN